MGMAIFDTIPSVFPRIRMGKLSNCNTVFKKLFQINVKQNMQNLRDQQGDLKTVCWDSDKLWKSFCLKNICR